MDATNEAIPGPAETHEDGHSTFGFGRRACAGKLLANEALFIYIATALWAANFERALDRDGKEAPIDTEKVVDTGMVLYAPYSSLMILQQASPIRVQDYCSVSGSSLDTVS